MFGRKKKDNNEDAVVWCPQNELEVVEQSKMINSLAVFAKADEPIYNVKEKPKKNIEYKANIESKFYIINPEHLKNIDRGNIKYIGINPNSDVFKVQTNPLVNKVIIDLDKKNGIYKSDLILKTPNYVIYGIPLENYHDYDQYHGDRFYMTILLLKENDGCKYVNTAFNFDLYSKCDRFEQYTFYKNPYFLRSLFDFISGKIGTDITVEMFEKMGLSNNEINF